jgi:hypothetical protein
MSSLLESTEYESFSLRDWDEKPLSLDEAIQKAEMIRSNRSGVICKVTPTDQSMTTFRVRVVSPEQVQAAFACRVAAFRSRWLRHRKP